MPQSSVDSAVAENLKAILRRKGRSAYSVATATGHAPNWLYRVLNQEAGILLPTLRKLAEELGVSVGEIVDPPSENVTSVPDIRSHPAHGISDTAPATIYGDEDDPGETIEIAEVATAVGVGAKVYDETTTERVPFRRSWLSRNRINPAGCHIISVRGGAMEPTLPDGCSIIVDRNRLELQTGRIYMMRTEEGLVVRRAKQNAQGWWLMSDNPEWAPLVLTEETDIIGEVRWAARTF